MLGDLRWGKLDEIAVLLRLLDIIMKVCFRSHFWGFEVEEVGQNRSPAQALGSYYGGMLLKSCLGI